MQLIEHDALQIAEQEFCIGRSQQKRHLLRRGQQHVGRIAALALALGGGGVAGARLDSDWKPHLFDGRVQVARHIDRERLQGRDVKRVQAAPLCAGDVPLA